MTKIAANETAARAAGFTKRVILDGQMATVDGLIQPDADIDGAFEVFDLGEKEWLVVSGWLIDDIEYPED